MYSTPLQVPFTKSRKCQFWCNEHQVRMYMYISLETNDFYDFNFYKWRTTE